MTYSTLLLDLDNTILSFDQAEKYALEKVMQIQGMNLDEVLFESYSKINKALWHALEQGEISREEVLSQRFVELFKILDLEVEGSAIDQLFRTYLVEKIFFMPRAMEVLGELKEEKQLYIVTNGVAVTQKERLKKAGLEAYFAEIFISEEIGHQKPSRLFFQHVLDNIEEQDKDKVLMVGDSLSADILGGNQIGIDTCWYSLDTLDQNIEPTFHIKSLDELLKLVDR